MEVIDLLDPRIALLVPLGIIIAGYVARAIEKSMLQGKGIIYRPEPLPTDVKVVGIITRIAGVFCFAIGLIELMLWILRWRGTAL